MPTRPRAARRLPAFLLAALGVLSGGAGGAGEGATVRWAPRECVGAYDISGKAKADAGGGVRILFEAADEANSLFLDVRGGVAVAGRIEKGKETPLAEAKGVSAEFEFAIQRRATGLAIRAGGSVLRPAPQAAAGRRFGVRLDGASKLLDIRMNPVEPPVFAEDFMKEPGDPTELRTLSGTWGIEPSPESDLNANPFRLAARAEPGEALALAVPAGSAAWAGYAVRAAVRPTERTAGAGLAFCASADSDLRLFRVRKGRAEIVRRLGGKDRVLASAPAALPADAWTEMAVASQGNLVRAFLDDAEILSVRDDSLFAGRAGLWAEGPGPTWFDDVQVRALDRALSEPASAADAIRGMRDLRIRPLGWTGFARRPGLSEGSMKSPFPPFEESRLASGVREIRFRGRFFGSAFLDGIPGEFIRAPGERGVSARRATGRPAAAKGGEAWLEAGLLASNPGKGAWFRLERPPTDDFLDVRILVDGNEAARGRIPSGWTTRRIRFEAGAGRVRVLDEDREALSVAAHLPASGGIVVRRPATEEGALGLRAGGGGFVEYDFLDAQTDWFSAAGRIGTVNLFNCQPDIDFFGIDGEPFGLAWNKRPFSGDFDLEFAAAPQTRVRTGQALALPYGIGLCLAPEGLGPGSGYDFLFLGPGGPLEIRRKGRLVASTKPARPAPRSSAQMAYGLLNDWRLVRVSRTGRRFELSASRTSDESVSDAWRCAWEDPEPIPVARFGLGTAGAMMKLSRFRLSAERVGERSAARLAWAPPPAGAGDLRVLAGGEPEPGPAPSPSAAPSVPAPPPAAPGAPRSVLSFRSGPEGVEADGGVEGPTLVLVDREGRPGDRAISLRSPSFAGSMRSILLRGPIDPACFPELRLEYRVPPGVSADLFAEAGTESVRIPLADLDPWPEGDRAGRGARPPAVADGTWRVFTVALPKEAKGKPAVWDRIVLKDGGIRANPAGAWIELDEIALVPGASPPAGVPKPPAIAVPPGSPPAAPFVAVFPPVVAIREDCEGPLSLSRSRHGNLIEPARRQPQPGRRRQAPVRLPQALEDALELIVERFQLLQFLAERLARQRRVRRARLQADDLQGLRRLL
ncbi:MAG: hypothetical protein AAB215_09865, partial [Planctomycetota bacterium]